MKFFKSNNIFDSFKFYYYLNKLSGYLFFTIKKDKHGSYSSSTTMLDISALAISLAFCLFVCAEMIGVPFKPSSRSVILDLGIFILTKLVAFDCVVIVLFNFLHRHKTFQILKNCHWIDGKVKTKLFIVIQFIFLLYFSSSPFMKRRTTQRKICFHTSFSSGRT